MKLSLCFVLIGRWLSDISLLKLVDFFKSFDFIGNLNFSKEFINFVFDPVSEIQLFAGEIRGPENSVQLWSFLMLLRFLDHILFRQIVTFLFPLLSNFFEFLVLLASFFGKIRKSVVISLSDVDDRNWLISKCDIFYEVFSFTH